MTPVIEARQITRRYAGALALQDVDLTVESGSILGLIGSNGSGKSTLIRLLAGVDRTSTGDIFVLGQRPGVETKARVGYLPEVDHVYPGMTARRAARYLAAVFEDFEIDRAFDLWRSLAVPINTPFGRLSRGMRARFKLAMVLARRADLLLLDEPLAGVDLASRDQILTTMLAAYRTGEQAIVMATHHIGEAEALFDRIVFLKNGRVHLSGAADVLRAQRGKSIEDIYREEYA